MLFAFFYRIYAALLHGWFGLQPWKILAHKVLQDLDIRGLVELVRFVRIRREAMVIADLGKQQKRAWMNLEQWKVCGH